ncbi:glucose 1-dehydrogenase [Glaciimonas sp. Gout2]|uniref:SDR family NAD(P)-dependent oxidoreductase n=1 Tax=unclassified Glaciimonas TaxID=2644401 RepID=UPI002B237A60|nr:MULTISPECIES: glucose 1-dehydrogenase [unclassified Glaciimonas]MEB0012954.1 glucose 1-dehydrogenase [Glaciimonas sp. Cout2]MEB0082910.1 glucose 1-dehydrogenase [Glaciimonas sp. Gout2]
MESKNAGLLDGKLVLITGAGQGIGREIAYEMAQVGAKVILTDIGTAGCKATAEQISADGGSAWHFELDVTDVEACGELAEKVLREIGNIDCLINNAGILIREGIDSPNAHQNLRRVLDVNLIGPFNMIHAWLPALRATRGNIINIASGAAFVGIPGTLGYSPSKGGLKMLTQSMANDLAADGIRVNAIAPGVIETPMTEVTRSSKENLENFMRRIPMRRLGQPRELAGPIIFLASELATYVTGVTLPVDGGFLAA